MTSTQFKFNGEVLRICRQFHAKSQAELGDQIGASRQFIHQLEIGEKIPTKIVLNALAVSLNVDSNYFNRSLLNIIRDEDCHFRKLRTTPQWLINQIVAHGAIFNNLLAFIETRLDLPSINFPTYEAKSNEDIENAAEKCRQHWGLTVNQPIKNMIRVVENAGAIVTSFEGVSTKLDALSIHRPRPVIIRSNAKQSPTRIRFDIAHECGHLVLHKGIVTGDHATEAQADRFAGAFLLPRSAFIVEFPIRRGERIDWKLLKKFKERWKVSLQAIIRRAYELNLIDASQYRRAHMYINKTGQRTQEEAEPSHAENSE
ncbi:MAG: helix-turn-helix domain-containing protein, partial [Candidatus Saccharimonadales bacterium]